VIVVVGSPRARRTDSGATEAAGLPAEIALAAVGAGASVQIVGRVGEDGAGEAVMLDLARRDVGHVAVLRDAGHPTLELAGGASDDVAGDATTTVHRSSDPSLALDAADLELALSYLPEYAVIVVAEPLPAAAMRVAVEAARWAGASLVVARAADESVDLPDDSTVFAPAEGDETDAFASMVGTYAARLDQGDDPSVAFDAATAAVGSTASE
jgi:sugar/nucleoside kinase (ribokinase family)